jgi:nitroreductase
MSIIILPLQTLTQSSATVAEMHGGEYTMTQNEDSIKIEAVFETIRNRRTVREFNASPVPQEHIIKILDAARYAPTAGNVQPWKFVVIQNRERLDSLCQILQVSWKKKLESMTGLNPEQRDFYTDGGQEAIRNVMTAPVYIIVFVDTTVYPKYALYDGCLAVENLMIAARALGYGTGFFTTYFPENVIKDYVNAPANLLFVCATPVGVPKAWPETPPKKELHEFIVNECFEKK